MLRYHSSNCRASIHPCFVFLPPPDSTNDQFQPSAYLFMSVLHLVPLCCRCISSSIMWHLSSPAPGSDGISLFSFFSFSLWGFVEPHTRTLSCAHTCAHAHTFFSWIIWALSFSFSVSPHYESVLVTLCHGGHSKEQSQKQRYEEALRRYKHCHWGGTLKVHTKW